MHLSWLKGGGGYVLSKKAFSLLGKKLSLNMSFCKETGAEVISTFLK
jgi:hypothetical protein